MADAEPTIETLQEDIGLAEFAITGEDAARVVHLLGQAVGLALRHRAERDHLRDVELYGVTGDYQDLEGAYYAVVDERDALMAVAVTAIPFASCWDEGHIEGDTRTKYITRGGAQVKVECTNGAHDLAEALAALDHKATSDG